MARMTTGITGFGGASFDILWESNEPALPGWEQQEYVNTVHVPGSDFNDTYFMGSGPLMRALRVVCADRAAYEALHALKRTAGVLRMPATLNELGAAVEVDYFGTIYAELADVTLIGLSDVRVWVHGEIEVTAQFQRDDRT
jgi:hypothetical protein